MTSNFTGSGGLSAQMTGFLAGEHQVSCRSRRASLAAVASCLSQQGWAMGGMGGLMAQPTGMGGPLRPQPTGVHDPVCRA